MRYWEMESNSNHNYKLYLQALDFIAKQYLRWGYYPTHIKGQLIPAPSKDVADSLGLGGFLYQFVQDEIDKTLIVTDYQNNPSTSEDKQ